VKILFFTDTHIKGSTPKNRKDDFPSTLKNKFNEISELIEKYDVDFVLHGGDWFDRPDTSPSTVRDFAILLQAFGRPIYTTVGNHDIYGHNPSTVGRTMLGLLEGIGIFKLLGHGDVCTLEKDGVKVQLTAQPYNYDIDGENFRQYYVVKKLPDVDFAINMIHGMLLDKPFLKGVPHVLLKDIEDTEADITLAGHYHSGFGIKKIGQKYFVNPGSLARISNTVGELTRKPKVVLITLQSTIDIREIELLSAPPGDEVLDRSELEDSYERTQKLYTFYSTISSTTNFKKVDLNAIIEEIT